MTTVSVTGYTADRSAEIEASTVISVSLSPSGSLIFELKSGTKINAGFIAENMLTTISPSIVTLKAFNYPAEDVIVHNWNTGGENLRLTIVATLPTGPTKAVHWSPDGMALAMGHSNSPYVTVWRRLDDTFTKLTNPTTLPTAACVGAAWSPNGQYLFLSTVAAPYLCIYKYDGTLLTKLTNPASVPSSGYGEEVTWSPDSVYVAMGGNISSDSIVIYKRSGDTFTRLTFSDSRIGAINSIAFSNSGLYLAAGGAAGASEYILIAKRNADTFSLLPELDIIPNGAVRGVAWSPDDQYLAVATAASPGIYIYKRSGDTFTKLTNPPYLPPENSATGVSFSPDGKYLAVTTQSLTIAYRRSGDTFSRVNPSFPSYISNMNAPHFSPDGTYLAVVGEISPYVAIYKSMLGKIDDPIVRVTLVP